MILHDTVSGPHFYWYSNKKSIVYESLFIKCDSFVHNEPVTDRSNICKQDRTSYVYWTVHHIDSWVKRDQLDVTCFIISLFNAQHVSDVNTSILRSLRLMCWVISWVVLIWFDVCWCYVVVWLWWCSIHTQVEALVVAYSNAKSSASACIQIPHLHSQTTT